jgi:hypothetical protein
MRSLGTNRCVFFILAISFAVYIRPSSAELIDFETGYTRLQVVSEIVTPTNALTVSTEGGNNLPLFIAQVGRNPKDAFEKVVMQNSVPVVLGDTPDGGNPGRYFLTDGKDGVGNFVFSFRVPISTFSVDLYDFVGDGGASPSDTATLRAFSDSRRTTDMATDQFTAPWPKAPDGFAVTLSVQAENMSMIVLEFSTFDRGTGIDNIRFNPVPEPATLLFFAIGLAALIPVIRANSRKSTI